MTDTVNTSPDDAPAADPGALGTRIEDLTAALAAGTAPAGRLLGLPELPGDGVWVDTAGAAAIVGVPSQTITGWLSRSAPKGLPFPAPLRILYRLYWPLSEIEDWMTARPPR